MRITAKINRMSSCKSSNVMSCKLPFYITAKIEIKSKGTGAYTVALSDKRVYFLIYCWSSFPFESNVQQVLKGAQLEILTNLSVEL